MNSNRKAAPNGQAGAIIKEFNLEVLLNSNRRIIKKETTALTHVIGKYIQISCWTTEKLFENSWSNPRSWT